MTIIGIPDTDDRLCFIKTGYLAATRSGTTVRAHITSAVA